MPRLRISAISYLNTAPLMWNFERGVEREKLQEQFEVEYTIPSICAQKLAAGSADIGIIPVAAYTTIPDLRILPDVAIASKNAVRSILLVSSRSINEIRNVAIDSSSRSSAALVQVLFANYWGQKARFMSVSPQLESMLRAHDAALMIGDPALQLDRSKYQTWDLGEEWHRFTGLPFVFAFWAVRGEAAAEDDLADLTEIFRRSRDAGLSHIAKISSDWSERLRLPPELISSYLSENIQYHLGAESIAGMQLFFRYAAELKILPPAPDLRFAPELEFRNSVSSNRF